VIWQVIQECKMDQSFRKITNTREYGGKLEWKIVGEVASYDLLSGGDIRDW